MIVRETVPDSIFEHTDEVELIDLPPDDLLHRLRDGKIYIPEQAREAIENFFRKGNLIALRELALRVTAQHVDAEMRHYMRDHAIRQTWPVRRAPARVRRAEPVLDPRWCAAAKRMAEGLGAEWIVAYVETPAQVRLPQEARDRVAQTLRLAEQLGAETHTLTGHRMSDEILAFARARNVSKIVVGKPERPLWKRIALGSIVDTLVQGSGEIDVYVISGDRDDSRPLPARPWQAQTDWPPYGYALAVVAICTGIAWAMFPYFAFSNLIMVYLLGVIVVATRYGRGPSLLASLLSVAAFDFFFVPPYYTFAVSDTQYFVTFSVMLIVAVVISGLAVRIRAQAESARERERPHRRALRDEPRAGQHARRARASSRSRLRHITERVPRPGRDPAPRRERAAGAEVAGGAEFPMDASELAVSQWVYEHGQVAGQGTDTLPGAAGALPAAAGLARRGGRARAPADRPAPARRRRSSSTSSRRSPARPRWPSSGRGSPRTARAGAGARRDRAAAQLAAQLGLPRSAHAAGLDHRRGQHPARERGAPRRGRPGAICWSRSTRRPTG